MITNGEAVVLEKRIHKLERRYRQSITIACLAVTLAVCCALVLILLRREVRTQRIVLLDNRQHSPVITLGVDDFDDTPVLRMFDHAGAVRINLGLSEQCVPGLGFVYDDKSVSVLSRHAFISYSNKAQTAVSGTLKVE